MNRPDRWQAYPEYRNSGVTWLGEIPSHWRLVRVKHLCPFRYGDSLPADAREQDGSVPVYGSNGLIGYHSTANTTAPALIIGRKGSYGKINLSSTPSFAIDTTYFVDPRHCSADIRWLYYALRLLGLDSYSQDSAIPGLSREHAHNHSLPYIPLPEQRAIADFLDRETARIDALIAKKQRLIELLQEKRTALISHAVTKGLDPDAPMKESGVAWLGEVPAHWKMVRIKHLGQVGNGSTPLRGDLSFWQDGTFPWLTSTVVNDDVIGEPVEFVTETALRECHLPVVAPNSVLIAITGQGKTRGKAALLPYEATINQHIAYVSPRAELLDPKFLQLFLSSAYGILRILSEGTGSTKGALTCEQIGEFSVSLPPLSEQRQIVSSTLSKKVDLDCLTQAMNKTIILLTEYRTALISAAVTGKIDVRGAA